MFRDAKNFDQDLSLWNTSKVFDMGAMFQYARSFRGEGIGNWDTSAVKNFGEMFWNSESFVGDGIGRWDVSNALDMQSMFFMAKSFNGDISSWKIRNVTDMKSMFREAIVFNVDLSSWNLKSVVDMHEMLRDAASYNQDLCAWGSAFTYDAAGAIFSGSNCTYQDTPQFDKQGPFCASSCTTEPSSIGSVFRIAALVVFGVAAIVIGRVVGKRLATIRLKGGRQHQEVVDAGVEIPDLAIGSDGDELLT